MSVVVENLRRHMAEKKLNARQINIRAELGRTGVNDILNGKSRAPTIVTLSKIAEVLEIDVSDLLMPVERAEHSKQILALFDFLPADDRQRVVQIAEALRSPVRQAEQATS